MNEKDRKKAIEAVKASDALALICVKKDGSREVLFFPGNYREIVPIIGGLEVLKTSLVGDILKGGKKRGK